MLLAGVPEVGDPQVGKATVWCLVIIHPVVILVSNMNFRAVTGNYGVGGIRHGVCDLLAIFL